MAGYKIHSWQETGTRSGYKGQSRHLAGYPNQTERLEIHVITSLAVSKKIAARRTYITFLKELFKEKAVRKGILSLKLLLNNIKVSLN